MLTVREERWGETGACRSCLNLAPQSYCSLAKNDAKHSLKPIYVQTPEELRSCLCCVQSACCVVEGTTKWIQTCVNLTTQTPDFAILVSLSCFEVIAKTIFFFIITINFHWAGLCSFAKTLQKQMHKHIRNLQRRGLCPERPNIVEQI